MEVWNYFEYSDVLVAKRAMAYVYIGFSKRVNTYCLFLPLYIIFGVFLICHMFTMYYLPRARYNWHTTCSRITPVKPTVASLVYKFLTFL